MKKIKTEIPKYITLAYFALFVLSVVYAVYLSQRPGDAGQFAFIPVILTTFPTSYILGPVFDKIGYIDWYSQYANTNTAIYLGAIVLMCFISFMINAYIIYKLLSFITSKIK